jgi:threonine dehydratase
MTIDPTAAADRIRPYVRETPFEPSLALAAETGADVWLKHEQLQHTGSFKVRGALSALLALPQAQRERGIVTASSGNHGMAIAYGMRALGLRGVIFVPEDASTTKVAAIRALGAEVRLIGEDCLISEGAARSYAEASGMPYVSPYNDPHVVAGQGTLGAEIVRQSPGPLDAIFIAVGGGGLISGVASVLRQAWPGVEVVGCQPEASAVMAESIAAGQIVELPDLPTLSDGTAGGIESGSITFPLCQQLVSRFVRVTEREIAAEVRWMIEQHHTLIEGAAGVALAGFRREAARWRGRRIGVVLCGANLSVATLRAILGEEGG